MATKSAYKFSEETLSARAQEAKNWAHQKEMDYFRLSALTPADSTNQEAVEVARAEAERLRELSDKLQDELASKQE